MAEINWEKSSVLAKEGVKAKKSIRWQFLVVGVALLGVIAYLLISSAGARYYLTLDELVNDPSMLGKTVRVSGAVVGDPAFNPETQELHFVVANIPNDNNTIREQGGLAAVLHKAVEDPNASRVAVIAYDKEIPDMLQNEAQAIMSGRLVEENGQYVFHAEEIMLKCPSRYQEDVPQQVAENS
ncbi:MAG TPA: cytochrome c maturation protein CcmE [Aggregatilinea sp.]|jgi:cytochrome c-type biogenesis protein CcmE|uniref:cytochrome c maturation protein CcmE domain-containing protein n=1 Tax=Aggregatilinea sp. TaxID=2806333 RepID=UPI002BE34596|nr:cytochrome c maturation protein CcmE [Aggregatilinea sp.]HML23917.1 cytochrome c maturation protein CcmE [Aggregatilinea sp.]